ncbi:hypothetical protein EDB81DRAFT_761451 [Dactylonectria macrodidyma]|uniref:Uncharacterized protein n=1 Tax=Dactylonectria macrodidyma TaxID=307937 RepID=A0A9P9EPU7_9HYPO|nr:hypothetical protein EDB81DRAFT_761451 [Dactylonectria macrodidyma]
MDSRMTGSALKNLHMFQALCGKKTDMSHVVLATSMWDNLNSGEDHNVGVARETELRSSYWADMLDCGSQMFWHDNSRGSALPIIQREMVVEKCTLDKTLAGEQLLQGLLAERAKHERDLAAAKRSHEQAMQDGSEKMMATLAKREREYQKKLDQLDRDREECMQVLQQDYAKLQQDQQKKWQRAVEDLKRKKQQLEEMDRQEKSQVQALKTMQEMFDAKMDEMQRDRDQREAARDAKAQQQRDLNQMQIAALEAMVGKYEKDAADLDARKNRPVVLSVIQALAGAGVLAASFKSGSTALMASGTGLLTSAASNFNSSEQLHI